MEKVKILPLTEINKVSGEVVDAAIEVHSALGPGLLESVYENCLAHELSKRGLKVENKCQYPLFIKIPNWKWV